MKKIYTAYKLGSCRSGSDNTGSVTHALEVPQNGAIALCGAKPGRRSNGWAGDAKKEVTCIKCLAKLSKIDEEVEFVYDNNLDVGF